VELQAAVDAARNVGDADAFASHWTDDETAGSPGQLSVGRSAIRADEATGFAGPMEGTRHS
jgi:hypothetical protein